MTEEPVSEDQRRRIESFVTEWMTDDSVPGTGLAVFDADQVLYAEGFGARDLRENDPATERTLYGVGSCTKSVTAVAASQLAESGELSLDDPVADYLPYVAEIEGKPITIHDLLCHGSGMPSDGNLSALLRRLTDMDPMPVPLSSEADFRRHVRGSGGERITDGDRPFFYYNTGFTLVGEVIEAVSGQPYHEYVREHVLAPLGMDRSGFTRERFESSANRMTPYRLEDGEPVEADLAFDDSLFAPGGLISSPVEFARYCRLYLTAGEVDGGRILGADSIRRMRRPHNTRSSFIDGTERKYGYGLETRPFLGEELIRHGGMMGTTTAAFGVLPGTGLGVTLACNTAPDRHPSTVMLAILAILKGRDPERVVPRLVLEGKADAVTGQYESYRGVFEATVETDGGRLVLTTRCGDREFEFPLLPESFDPDEHQYYTMTADGKRVPARFRIRDDGIDLLYRRWRLRRTGG